MTANQLFFQKKLIYIPKKFPAIINIFLFNFHRCSATQVQSCGACVKLRDPHCAWNIVSGACVDKNLFTNADASELIQDIFHGKHSACDASTRIATSGSGPTMEESNIVQHSIDLQDDDYDVSDNVILNDIPDDYPYMVISQKKLNNSSLVK